MPMAARCDSLAGGNRRRAAGLWVVLLLAGLLPAAATAAENVEEAHMWLSWKMARKYAWQGLVSPNPQWIWREPAGEGRTVVLIHGLLHRSPMFEPLAEWLQERHGCRVIFYDYPTTRQDVEGHAVRLSGKLRELQGALPGVRIDFITHSMGGILLRLALAELEQTGDAAFCGRVVMLAPPHHGSPKATGSLRLIPGAGWLVRPLADLADHPAARIHLFPVPEAAEAGVIAGTHDRTVPLASTRLGTLPHCQVAAGHCSILGSRAAWNQAWHFLETGQFALETAGEAE